MSQLDKTFLLVLSELRSVQKISRSPAAWLWMLLQFHVGFRHDKKWPFDKNFPGHKIARQDLSDQFAAKITQLSSHMDIRLDQR